MIPLRRSAPPAAVALALLAALAVAPPAPRAAAAAPPRLDSRSLLETELDALRGKHGVPALGAALWKDGKVALLAVAGIRARGSDAPAASGDLWHVGSCTKAMTATLCARLVEEGKLRWDAPVTKALAGEVKEPHEGWNAATLERLLRNRGGAPASLDEGGLWAGLWSHPGPPRSARIALARGVLARAPEYEPGSRMLYANAGFALAGAMAETAADRAWEDLLREKVFAPLGIRSAGFGAPGAPGAKEPDQPRGHREDGTAVPPGPGSDNPPAIGPAGTVHMSLEDLARWGGFHLRGARGEEASLSKESWKRLHEPPAGEDYAMGWRVVTRPKVGRTLWHNGSNTMWYASVLVVVDGGYAVVAACNAGGKPGTAAVEAASAFLARHAAEGGK